MVLASVGPRATPTPPAKAPEALGAERLATMKTLAHHLERLAWRASNVARESGEKVRAQSGLLADIDAFAEGTLTLHERLDSPTPVATVVSDVATLETAARGIEQALRKARARASLLTAWRGVVDDLVKMTRALRGSRVDISPKDREIDGQGDEPEGEHHRAGTPEIYHPPFPLMLDETSRMQARRVAHELDEQLGRAAELADRLAPVDELGPLISDLHHLHEEAARFHALAELDAPDANLVGMLIRHLLEDGSFLDRQLATHDVRDSLGPTWPRTMALLDQLDKLLR